MNEQTLSFNEGQFKRAGLAEAFTPEVIDQMKQGTPLIKSPFTKQYDADTVNAVLYAKKSAGTDYYFLNKFELELQKNGQSDPLKQTFYVNRYEKKEEPNSQQPEKIKQDADMQKPEYTLKKAYNLLAERPVFDEPMQNWKILNPHKTLDNGNHEIQTFSKQYGFNLQEVMGQYSLKEPPSEQDLQSLYRGNMQKLTFVDKDGTEEKLYVSPGIKTGSLKVYDLDKKPVSVETQLEKQYISKELGEKLLALFAQKQEREPTARQEVKPASDAIPKQTNEQKQTKKTIQAPKRTRKIK